MPFLPEDERFLQAALTLARDAVGLASPNPTVGCVLVRDSAFLGEGAHRFDDLDHAEIVALKAAAAAGNDVRGATAYVSLEPCAHHGRTGPCAEALAGAGIARCVAATVDPNPLVSGQGFVKLRKAGVDVQVAAPSSPAGQQARRLNDPFAFAVQHRRPFVTLKAALSVDGKLAPPRASRSAREPFWLTGSAARADVQKMRHGSDAILTGIGTVLADDPSLTDRTGLPRRRPLQRIVLDPALRTPPGSALLHPVADDLLLIASPEASRSAEKELCRAGAEVLRLPINGNGFLLRDLLSALASRRLNSLLLEGGTGVNSTFLRSDLVDRAVLYYAETELGTDAIPFAHGDSSPYTLQGKLTSVEHRTFPSLNGEDVRISGYLHDPWADVSPAGE